MIYNDKSSLYIVNTENMKKINYLYILFLLPLLFSCELEQLPSDSVSSIQAFSSAKGIEQATVGQYDTFKKNIVLGQKEFKLFLFRNKQDPYECLSLNVNYV